MSTPYREKWTSDCGTVTLYCGDCLEILPTLEAGSVDAVVTDPPYGNSTVLGMGGGSKGSGGMWAGVGIANDSTLEVRDAAIELAAVSFAAFCSPRRPLPPNTKAVVCWDKGEHTGAGDLDIPWKPSFELVAIGGRKWTADRRIGGVVRCNAVAGCVGNSNTGHRNHPFEKPVEICEHFVARVDGCVIADPFMGSGTTGVACVRLGRRFIGIELEPKYYAIAKRRIQDELDRVKFLEPPKRETQRTLVEVEA